MHKFYLINKNETETDDFFMDFAMNRENYKGIIVDYITIEIKVFDYIYDSLTWIPCMNPAFPGNPKQVGINHLGIHYLMKIQLLPLFLFLLLGEIYLRMVQV